MIADSFSVQAKTAPTGSARGVVAGTFAATVRCNVALLGTSAVLLAALPAAAHHSVAINFERGEPTEIRGTVKEVHMRNPHSQYVVAVPGKDGTVTEWLVEWSDRNSLVRRGVDLDLIKPGDTSALTLWPSQRLANVGYFVQAVLADGSIYRDCGFVKYREAVAASSEFRCEEGTRGTAPRAEP